MSRRAIVEASLIAKNRIRQDSNDNGNRYAGERIQN